MTRSVDAEQEIRTLKALLRKSLGTIREINSSNSVGTKNEPLAIVGMACEFPGGVTTPDQYWELLSSGRECVRDEPVSEWLNEVYRGYFQRNPLAAGKARANYLDRDVMRFDPRSFNISPREARDMDPTQRLALKLTAQAFERAGHRPRGTGGRVGVYFGVIGGEYGALARNSADPGAYVATGSLNSVVAGRISHTFDFTGPAVAVDTACSSSLVALHLAAEGLRAGDCDVAVVGGVNLLLDPSIFTVLAGVSALSADGRCRPFAAAGEGYGRGEGGGVVILKRQGDAVRDRDEILALVRATAVNHDGTCSGLTVPNGRAQRDLMETALLRSGLRPGDIDYLEAHGTGTPLGDPIEMAAVSAVYCGDRADDRPLPVGSVKAQIGHLEAASGIASLIKLVLALQNRRIPAQLVAGEPNHNIDFDRLKLRPATGTEHLREHAVGALSSYGFSGTNGHAIVSAAEVPEYHASAGRQLRTAPIVLSGRSAAALTEQAQELAGHLRNCDVAAVDVGYTLAVGRDHGPFRMQLLADTREEIIRALEARLAMPRLGTLSRLRETGPAKSAFILGADVASIRRWYGEFAPFRGGFDAVAEAWAGIGGDPLHRWLDTTEVPARPGAAAALQLALLCGAVRLWQQFGIRPEIWAAEGIACYAVAIETRVLGIREALAEATRLVEGSSSDSDGSSIRTRSILDDAVICPRDGELLSSRAVAEPGYWAQAATASADFTKAAGIFTDFGVHVALLLGMNAESAAHRAISTRVNTVVCENDTDPVRSLTGTLSRLYELGFDIDWEPLFDGVEARRISLPTSVFDESTYAFDATPSTRNSAVTERKSLEAIRLLSPTGGAEVEFAVDPFELELADTHHVVHIGFFVEMLMSGLAVLDADRRYAIADMHFTTALVARQEPMTVRLVLEGIDGPEPDFSFYSLTDPAANRWERHVHGTVVPGIPSTQPERRNRSIAQRYQGGDEFYAEMLQRGLDLGPSVRGVGDVHRDGTDVWATVAPAHDAAPERAVARVSPALLDSCAQLFHAAMPQDARSSAFMVERLQNLVIHPGGPAGIAELRVENLSIAPGATVAQASMRMLDAEGRPVVECATCTVRLIDGGIKSVLAASGPVDDAMQVTEAERAAAAVGDRGSVEATVRRLLAHLTDTPATEIGPADSTTALGVDSLQATALYRALAPLDGQAKLTLADIVAGISVADLSALLGSRSGAQQAPAAAAAPAGVTETVVTRRSFLKPARDAARVRLLCIPYGGGTTLLFQQWQTLLGDDIDVCPVALPGRGERLAEPLVPNVYDIVDALEPEAAAVCDKPLVIYGHSAGALVGYLLAARLRRRGITAVSHVVVGAFSGPDGDPNPFHRSCLNALAEAGFPDIPDRDQIRAMDADALHELARLMMFPAARGVDVAFLRLALPILAADIRLVGSFAFADAEVLDVPITAIHGVKDDRVAEAEVRQWEHRTTGPFTFRAVPGDHFFLHPDQDQRKVLDIIREVLK